MTSASTMPWHEANQQYLVDALTPIREALTRGRDQQSPEAQSSKRSTRGTSGKTRRNSPARLDAPPALERLCAALGLSAFERAVLLMCAGAELAADFASVIAKAHGDPHRTAPTFGLALAALPDPHWSALVPAAPLRRWRLIDVGPGETLTSSSLRIDERILHYLAGVSYLDERLCAFLEYVSPPGQVPDSHEAHVRSIVEGWRTEEPGLLPVVHLCGGEASAHRAVAAAACEQLGLRLYALQPATHRRSAAELDLLRDLWARETLLGECGLLIEWYGDAANDGDLAQMLEQVPGCFFLSGRTAGPPLRRRMRTLEIITPTAREQRAIWLQSLGSTAARLNGHLDAIVGQFDLGAAAIDRACSDALRDVARGVAPDQALWQACRAQSRRSVDDLAARIVPAARWPDLVLPQPQTDILRQIAVHVRQRATVYTDWGFAARTSRGLGISALFAGPSGTGKTMAAEVLANELNLDLFHIDLSQVVSKYIGETEKNLRRVFDVAERGGAILLFDEADALFGKRSDVKDSHDRYANVEISYLLQRMEAYRGLAILTTNMKAALDPGFMRRIRFVVQFPFPDGEQRTTIWRRAFPPETPTRGLDYVQLAKLAVTGGNIRNIALNAAFLAADAREPVKMAHLFLAAQAECAKLERPLTDAEVGGWR
jgi:ATPase family associated with various cellular activities (AAA)